VAKQHGGQDQAVSVGVLDGGGPVEDIGEQDLQGVLGVCEFCHQGLQGVKKGDPVIPGGQFFQVVPEKFENLAAVQDKFGDVFFEEGAAEMAEVIKTGLKQIKQVGGFLFADFEIFGNYRVILGIEHDFAISDFPDFLLGGRALLEEGQQAEDLVV